MDLEPGRIETLEFEKFDPEIIEMIKQILGQNKIILETNRDLLKTVTMPFYIVKDRAADG